MMAPTPDPALRRGSRDGDCHDTGERTPGGIAALREGDFEAALWDGRSRFRHSDGRPS